MKIQVVEIKKNLLVLNVGLDPKSCKSFTDDFSGEAKNSKKQTDDCQCFQLSDLTNY